MDYFRLAERIIHIGGVMAATRQQGHDRNWREEKKRKKGVGSLFIALYLSNMNPSSRKTLLSFPSWTELQPSPSISHEDKGEQLIRYYGLLGNVSRGKKEKPEEKTEISKIDAPPLSKEFKKRCSYFIRKVYEANPLICPKCKGEMRIISFIDQPEVIKKILQHLGLWKESHAPPERTKENTFDPSYSQLV